MKGSSGEFRPILEAILDLVGVNGGGAQTEQPLRPYSPGDVSESLVNQSLSDSLLCLLTATLTGSVVGCADKNEGINTSHNDGWWLLLLLNSSY